MEGLGLRAMITGLGDFVSPSNCKLLPLAVLFGTRCWEFCGGTRLTPWRGEKGFVLLFVKILPSQLPQGASLIISGCKKNVLAEGFENSLGNTFGREMRILVCPGFPH